MVSLRSSLCSFLVRIRTGGKPKEIAEVLESLVKEPEMTGAFACARKHLVCTCICASLRAYMVAPSVVSHCSQV